MSDSLHEVTEPDRIPVVHRREIRQALREERRLLRAEICCLVVVVIFAVVRQLWLS